MIDKTFKIFIQLFILGLLMFSACSEDETSIDENGSQNEEEIDFTDLGDDYSDIAAQTYSSQWGVHNVHDPMIRKVGDYYYCFSTDVGYGISVSSGLQIRRSTNLVEWSFRGWVFDEIPTKGATWIEDNTSTSAANALWAPAFYEYNGEYRLYYSLPGNSDWVATIGLATSTESLNNWTEEDVLVGSKGYSSTTTNCIDPSVVVTPSNEHWMVYGSGSFIRIVQLDPETGLQLNDGDYGTAIAYRGYTNGTINGNIEGPEIIYNEETGYYYLFIAYDALLTKYNTRVGRSTNVDGPYYDMFGTNILTKTDNYPMITHPYKFKGHKGYQGVSHCTVFQDGNGQYYFASQARPVSNIYLMNLHVRQMFWTEDGWPLVSPERYAGNELEEIGIEGIPGQWEIIDFEYTTVPGYTQDDADVQKSSYYTFNEDGTIGSSTTNTWEYEYPWLTVTLNGETTNVHVSVGRDWENSIDSTIVFTGIKSSDGFPLWGKKVAE